MAEDEWDEVLLSSYIDPREIIRPGQIQEIFSYAPHQMGEDQLKDYIETANGIKCIEFNMDKFPFDLLKMHFPHMANHILHPNLKEAGFMIELLQLNGHPYMMVINMNNLLTPNQDLYLLPLVPHPSEESHRAYHVLLPEHEGEQCIVPLSGRPPLLLLQQAASVEEHKPTAAERKKLKACESDEGYQYVLDLSLIHLPTADLLPVGKTPCPDWMVDVVPGIACGQLFVARSVRDFRLLSLPLPGKEKTEQAKKTYPQPRLLVFSTSVLLDRRPGTQQVYYAPDPQDRDISDSVSLYNHCTGKTTDSISLGSNKDNDPYIYSLGMSNGRLLVLMRTSTDKPNKQLRFRVLMVDRHLTKVLEVQEFSGEFVFFPRNTNFQTKFRHKRQTFHLVSLAERRQSNQPLRLCFLVVAVCKDRLIAKLVRTEVLWEREFALLGCVVEANTRRLRVFLDLSHDTDSAKFGVLSFRLSRC